MSRMDDDAQVSSSRRTFSVGDDGHLLLLQSAAEAATAVTCNFTRNQSLNCIVALTEI